MKKIKIGQIGIGHNHGEAKMLAVLEYKKCWQEFMFRPLR